MKVRIYRNIRKKCWSILDPKTNRVIEHVDDIEVENAKFVVRKAGYRRALREKRKNVHAFIVGDIRIRQSFSALIRQGAKITTWIPVHYNPFNTGPHFLYGTHDARRPILSAARVHLDFEGRAWVCREEAKELQ